MIDTERLKKDAYAMGALLKERELSQIESYCELLEKRNAEFNLTAITDPYEVEQKHICDCIALAQRAELGDSFIDVGTGCGLPGTVLKILCPDKKATLIDSTAKKLVFVREAAKLIELDMTVLHGRAEELSRKDDMRESFDSAVARAVADLRVLAEYCLPFVRVGGYFIAQKGPDAKSEATHAQSIIRELGGKIQEVLEFKLPCGDSRSLVIVKKISQTPTKYPRTSAKITSELKKIRESARTSTNRVDGK